MFGKAEEKGERERERFFLSSSQIDKSRGRNKLSSTFFAARRHRCLSRSFLPSFSLTSATLSLSNLSQSNPILYQPPPPPPFQSPRARPPTPLPRPPPPGPTSSPPRPSPTTPTRGRRSCREEQKRRSTTCTRCSASRCRCTGRARAWAAGRSFPTTR